MPDKFSAEVRGGIMSKIRGSKTKPELILRKELAGCYLRYQPKCYGNPDFANKSKKVVVFVDGCFWHGCPKCYRKPKNNEEFWKTKVERNRARDKVVTKNLRRSGWAVIRIWEHQRYKNPKKCAEKVKQKITF